MVLIDGVQAFDTVGWIAGGSDDPSPHLYLFYKDPTANQIRILESGDLPAHGVWTRWNYSKDVITPSGSIRFSDATQIAAASTFGLGYSGNKKMIRVFAYCEDKKIRDYLWHPGLDGWRQGDLLHHTTVRIGGKFAAMAYDHGGTACFSIFYQDTDGWVHEGRKYGEDEWNFQPVGEMTGNNYGLWLNIWQQNGILNKRVVAQNLALDAQFREYTYDPILSIWNPSDENQVGIPINVPETFSGNVTVTSLIVANNPNDERIYFNRGDQRITERARINGGWIWGPNDVVFDSKPYTPLSSVFMTKTVGSDFRQWINLAYINKAGHLAHSEYRWQQGWGEWLRGAAIEM